MEPIKIPILRAGESPSAIYIIALKKAINSDGCSKSPDIHGQCCVTHDLMYRFRIDMWGQPCHKKDADNFLRKCMENASFLKKCSLVAKIYWLGVKAAGAWAYAEDVDNTPEYTTYFWTN